MQKDIQIYSEFSYIILTAWGNKEFKLIKALFEMPYNQSYSDQTYLAKNENDEEISFGLPAIQIHNTHGKLIELRDFMVSQGQPPWTGMTFTLYPDGRFSTEFSYDPLDDK